MRIQLEIFERQNIHKGQNYVTFVTVKIAVGKLI